MIKGVHHIGLSVASVERLSRFYRDVLGFDLVMEMDWEAGTPAGHYCDRIIGLRNSASKVAMVSKGGLIIELFEYRSPVPKRRPVDWQVSDHGYSHICLQVEDIDAEYARLRGAGMSFHAPPPEAADGMRAIYGRDPEGNVIELLEIAAAEVEK
ncbi:MAG: VOC family protein [Desulfuromonadales bacterium]|nr:VOC family protein [Desulfuromonadales bacterium]